MADLAKAMEERMKYRENLLTTIQNDIIGFSKKVKKLNEHDLETYQQLTEPDALFNDCPLSPFLTAHHIKQFMIKMDLDFIGYVLDGKQTVKNLQQVAKEVSVWTNRFAVQKVQAESGVAAIIKKGKK